MDRIIKILFFALIIKPLVFIILGLNVRGWKNLPLGGPAIVVANHNSHLDTVVLMSLYPLSVLHRVRPVAAADYFLSNSFLSWFSKTCIGIIPLDRNSTSCKSQLFQNCHNALDNGEILILFPEGTRGNPEEIGELKKGLFYLVNNREETKITPVVLHGLGRSLPRGEALLVPFNCDVIIGDPLPRLTTATELVEHLSGVFDELRQYCLTRNDVEKN